MDKYEKMARKYVDELLTMYECELATPVCAPPEVEGARWLLICLTNPRNRDDLNALVKQSDLRAKGAEP